jgi:hypothetical protein
VPTFYRIVKTDPPTVADFLSYRAQGRRLIHDTPELRRSWEGVSVYDSIKACTMVYFILDLESGNYVNTYDTEADALADVRDVMTRFGQDDVLSWALARREDDRSVTPIAEGDALLDRALGRTPAATE